jgi:hypothetical protein
MMDHLGRETKPGGLYTQLLQKWTNHKCRGVHKCSTSIVIDGNHQISRTCCL